MSATAAPTSLSPLAVFRNPAFALLWSGQLISTIGSALSSLVATILVFRITGRALSVGLMLMATSAPSLLVGKDEERRKMSPLKGRGRMTNERPFAKEPPPEASLASGEGVGGEAGPGAYPPTPLLRQSSPVLCA
jgi:hypothetical protein